MEKNDSRLKYSKGRNLVYNPDTDAPAATRIIRCLGNLAADTPPAERTGRGSCSRVVVEYGQYVAETRHRNGISEEAMKLALDAGAAVVDAVCDHHGGHDYERYAPLIPPVENATETTPVTVAA